MSGYIPLENTTTIPSPDPYHCPSRAETLTWMDQLFVYKEETMQECLVEACCEIKPSNKYLVIDGIGNKDSECCNRYFCASKRSFIMNVTNVYNQDVIRLVHPFSLHRAMQLDMFDKPGIVAYLNLLLRMNELLSLDEEATERSFGKIIKPFLCCGSNADFVLRFPSNLDVKMKATLLGACVLIVKTFF
ncbi:Phospholipid scramblase 2 [Labeo rohita]|uniref:Phospholipid scramblase n=1 Tax=Labeo rohita TaxID=84645 RepID=A0ABQ8MWX1_LABRO|nr:Phospholipid scramblase 2 [Labeo rohita]